MNKIIEHLKNPEVKRCISARRKIKDTAHQFLKENGFYEYDTPVLIPEGGEKYNPVFDIDIDGIRMSLADSPQIYKMILFHAGYENYYQFAHCFRPVAHETALNTRLCEFIQLDIEMKADSLEKLIEYAEKLIYSIIISLNLKPVIRHIDGIECRRKYGDEMKPDLRQSHNEISVVFIERMPLTNDGFIPCHHIFASPSVNISAIDKSNLTNITTESFDIVINGIEAGGGDLRITSRQTQEDMMRIFNVNKERYSQYLDILENYCTFQNGGFAFGIERMIQALYNYKNISSAVLFPDFYKKDSC